MAAAALVAFAMSTSAIDVPRVANTLLEFSGDNQQALLEVIVDYIISPDDGRNSNSDKEDIPSDEPSCKVGKNKIKHDTIMMKITILNVKLPHTA